jgi:hypothetical protein
MRFAAARRRGGARERSPRQSHRSTGMRKLRVGQSITPEEFDELSDERLVRLVPRAYREFFPGKDFCPDGCFFLHDGTVWSFYKGGLLDD